MYSSLPTAIWRARCPASSRRRRVTRLHGLTAERTYSHAVTDQPLEEAAVLYEATAAELELAARHCRTAARHFRAREVPRAAAHAWAAFGHVCTAQDSLE